MHDAPPEAWLAALRQEDPLAAEMIAALTPLMAGQDVAACLGALVRVVVGLTGATLPADAAAAVLRLCAGELTSRAEQTERAAARGPAFDA